MKTLLLSFFCLSFLCYELHSEEIPVTPETFATVYSSASDNDVLLLATGEYKNNFNFPSAITVTLKAAEGASPIFKAEIRGNTETNNGGLIFDGVEINRNDSYVISAGLGDIKLIAFRNLTISNINRCLLNTSTAGYTIDKIEIENCIIKDCGSGGWNLIYPKHSVKNVSVKNSTLYNYMNGESFFFPNQADTDNVLNFVFENNTIYKWAKDSGRALANVSNKYNANSTYVFRNNIITEPGVAGQSPKIVNISGGTVTADNNLVVNYGSYSGGTQTINDLTLEGLGITEIGFPDPVNGDFTLTNSPLATAGTSGGPIGDPRWIKEVANAVTLTAAPSLAVAGSVTPTSQEYSKDAEATVSATANYGYRFKEWQVGGSKVSEANPYTFTITDDIALTAVFEAVTTYTLTINKYGEGANWGKIILNPEPINGIYEENEVVTVSIMPNSVTSFVKWQDNGTELSRQITMTDNTTVSATFDLIPFIVGWNFDPTDPRGNRPADFYYNDDNKGLMKLFNGDGSNTSWGASTKNFGGITYTSARRYTDADKMDNPRYFEAEFSAKGYKNILIHSYVGADNVCVYKKQKLQYATSATGPYTDLETIDLTDSYNSEWVELSASLPSLGEEDLATIYVRWVSDTDSEMFGTPSGSEGFYLADVVVYAEEDNGNPTGLLEESADNAVKVYYNPNTNIITVEASDQIASVEIYNTNGVSLINKKCNTDFVSMDATTIAGLNLVKVTLKEGKTSVSKIIIKN